VKAKTSSAAAAPTGASAIAPRASSASMVDAPAVASPARNTTTSTTIAEGHAPPTVTARRRAGAPRSVATSRRIPEWDAGGMVNVAARRASRATITGAAPSTDTLSTAGVSPRERPSMTMSRGRERARSGSAITAFAPG